MELFYSKNIIDGESFLDEQESYHCVRVLRYVVGDILHVTDGKGNLYCCRIRSANPKKVEFCVETIQQGYGSHPYYLHLAVAPPKNSDRFEWFTEKATEIGIDEITPLVCDYSERRVFKKERIERITISAAKQSHKGALPTINNLIRSDELIKNDFGEKVKIICYCDDVSTFGVQKQSFKAIVEESISAGKSEFVAMIGPEGDFSPKEIESAIKNGWQVASLGESRLRIETAALLAVSSVYLLF